MTARVGVLPEFHRRDDPALADVLRRDGVVLLENLLDAEQIARLRQELSRYQREVLPRVPRAHWHTYSDGSVHSMSGMEEFDEYFANFARDTDMVDMVRNAVPWRPTVHYLESFPKPAGAAAVTAHQELYTNPIDPPHFLHLWIALEDVTAENGGLTFYRGSHRIGMAPHEVADEHMGAPRIGPDILRQLDHLRIDPDYPAGSGALFDGWMVHASGANLSGRDRPVIIIAFRDADAEAPSERDNIASYIAEVARAELPDGRCGPDDSFFALGGDSLAAVRVLAQVRERYGVRVSLGEMFTSGTPRELAALVAAGQRTDDEQRPSIRSAARRRRTGWGPLALSQRPFFDMDRAMGGPGLFNTVIDIELRGEVDPDALRAAIGDVVRRQPILRTVYGDGPEGPAQRVLDLEPPIPQLDLRGGTRTLRQHLRREHLTGFDISAEPAARFSLLRTADDRWSVVSTMHHLATDGWSTGVLAADLADAYRRRVEGAEPAAPLPAQYLDFARWQRDVLTGDRLEAHLDYFAELLREPLPSIGMAATTSTYRTAVEEFELGEDNVLEFQAVARQLRTTPFVITSAALVSFARGLTGSRRQLISTQSANRTWPGSQDLIGCFSAVLNIGVGPAADTAGEMVGEVGRSLAAAVSHEELPLDHALQLLDERGEARHGHVPQLAYALQPVIDVPIELPGCVQTARYTAQPEGGVDPTTYPLVVEMYAGGTGSGMIRRMPDRWTDDAYQAARTGLLSTFATFPGEAGRTLPSAP